VTTVAFEPIGEVSRREAVVNLFEEIPHDTVVTYDEIGTALDVSDRAIIQTAVGAAKREIERRYSKALIAVPNSGYRVVRPAEQLTLARSHQQRSAKQLKLSKSKLDHVDLSQLTPAENAMFVLAREAIAHVMDYMRKNDIRAARLEQTVETVKQESVKTTEEIAELNRRLADLENRLHPK
jgi:alkylated DNA nucleotide flippase Atl1